MIEKLVKIDHVLSGLVLIEDIKAAAVVRTDGILIHTNLPKKVNSKAIVLSLSICFLILKCFPNK